MTDTHRTRYLDEKSAADLYGLSRAWFQRKRWEGGGPPYRKIGHAVRYPEDTLRAWFESHRLQKSTAENPSSRAAA
jgi:predicted DNA-binding transcriptional regulator AlpA